MSVRARVGDKVRVGDRVSVRCFVVTRRHEGVQGCVRNATMYAAV